MHELYSDTEKYTLPTKFCHVEINLQVNICVHGREPSNAKNILFHSQLSSGWLCELGEIIYLSGLQLSHL